MLRLREILSDALPLFLPARTTHPRYADAWVPNPGCSRLDLFRRVGKIIGVAISSDIALAMQLPPHMWKKLVAIKPSKEDIDVGFLAA